MFALLLSGFLSIGFPPVVQEAVAAQWPSCAMASGRAVFSVLSIKVDGEGNVTAADPLTGNAGFLERAADASRGAIFPTPPDAATLGLFCGIGSRPRMGYIFHPEAFQQNSVPVRIAPAELEANITNKVQPAYPAMAKARNIQGPVLLDAVVDSKGDVASLFSISGPPELLHSAIEAVRQWKYKPFSQNGAPISVETTIKVLCSVNR